MPQSQIKRVWWKVALLYAVIAIAALAVVSSQQNSKQRLLDSQVSALTQAKQVTGEPIAVGKPVRLVIASAGIDLNVVDGEYSQQRNEWHVAPNDANFALNSFMPDPDHGSTLIYGHDLPNVMHGIKSMTDGTEAVVYTSTGYAFSYLFKGDTKITSPHDTSVFSTLNAKPELILMTCDGGWYQDRFIARLAYLKAVKL